MRAGHPLWLIVVVLASCAGVPVVRERPAPRVAAAAAQLRPAPDQDGLPALIADDGAPLRLVALRARGVVEDPLAFTELQLTFRNPEKRALAAQFRIALPPGAAVSRFAVRQAWGWQEAEVVERGRARAVHEELLRARQAPALLEKNLNLFTARVAAIPASGEKTLVISYSQELPQSSSPYRLPLHGLPQLETVDVQVILERPGAGPPLTEELKHRAWRPDRDFVAPRPAPGRLLGLRHERLAVVRVTPIPDAARDPLTSLLVLFDTSASRALGFDAAVDRLGALLAAVQATAGPQLPVRVVCFDQTVTEVFHGPAGQAGAVALPRVRARGPLGASDLGRALRFVAASPGRAARVVVITDGVPTAGALDRGALRAAAAQLRAARVERLDVVAEGGIRDEALLRQLVTAGLPRDGALLDGALPATEHARRLGQATVSGITLTVPGATWSWPTHVDGVQPGDQVLVYADLPTDRPLEVVVGGARTGRHAATLATVPGPLLERAVASARIRHLTERLDQLPAGDPARADRLRDVLALSLKHRVLSDLTALLVLEREADYARFKLDRRALADVLVMGKRGLEVQRRRQAAYRAALDRGLRQAAARDRDRGDATPAGGFGADWAVLAAAASAREARPGTLAGEAVSLGVLGAHADEPAAPGPAVARRVERGDSGLRRGGPGVAKAAVKQATAAKGLLEVLGSSGRGGNIADIFGPDRGPDALAGVRVGGGGPSGGGLSGLREASVVGTVRLGTPEVTGSLDAAAVTRVVRTRLAALRSCYERELRREPRLAGTVAVDFVIAPSGVVAQVQTRSATLPDATVQACVGARVRGWRFPGPPRGGIVKVTFPFTFAPAGDARTATATPPPAAPAAVPAPPAPPPPPWARQEGEHEPFSGAFREVMAAIQRGRGPEALALVTPYRAAQPGEVLPLLALGLAYEALGQREGAARAYGSIIDLFPGRADLRRLAGQRLERLGLVDRGALELAVDTFRRARDQRPDHPHGHRLLALALLRAGDAGAALDAVLAGLARSYPARFPGAARVLREDAGLIAAAAIGREPARAAAIRARLKGVGAEVASAPSLRLVLTWETDDTDVDFHVFDGRGGHARSTQRTPPTGGELYANVTAGFGPECFAVTVAPGKALPYPYRLKARYVTRGPFGFGAGKLEVIEHDGRGGLAFEERPFVVTTDMAYVDLGTVPGPLRR